MCHSNQTKVTEFLLLGISSFRDLRIVMFVLFLILYIAIIIENLLIVTLVSVSHHLKHPMYFFLKNLACADILSTSNVITPLLYVIVKEKGTISVSLCIFQYYLLCFSGFSQSLLLTAMSFDRCLAICNPLRYTTIMSPKICFQLACCSWFVALVLITSDIILMYQLQFCDSNVIDHFFCDIGPVLQLSSTDTLILSSYDYVLSMFFIFVPFVVVIISYVCIVVTILKMSSDVGRKKAFSTCSSHLTVVCTYYGTLITIYLVPSSSELADENKFRTLLYTVLTPLVNPIIYCLRNQEIASALNRFFQIKQKM